MATSNRNLFPHSYQGNVDSSSIMFISYYLLMQGLRGILVRPRKKTNMSLTIKVYCKKVSKDLIPKMMNRLNDYDMVVSVHPDFKFDAEEDSGYLPFKFRLKDPRLSILKDKELKSGFELYIDEFDLHTEKENLKPKMSFFDKLLGKKQMEIPYAAPEVEALLKNCVIVVSFVWHASDSFASRFASLTSAILTELTDGVCSYEDETWYETRNIVDNAFKDILEYEDTLTIQNIDYMEFDKW